MTRTKAKAQIARAVDVIEAAYWSICDAEGRAVDPDDLDAPPGLLDAAHDVALRIEDLATSRGISWAEARAFF
jgi:hypothetical protein